MSPTATDADRPDRPPTARFLAALDVKRNAAIGTAVGVVVAAVVYVFFVVLGPGTIHSPVFYLGLAFVLATAVAGIVTLLLTIRSAVALSRELSDEADPGAPGADAPRDDEGSDSTS